MSLPQNQCLLHTLFISSMGMFFVSGTKKNVKTVIINTKAAKKKKSPNLRWQSMGRNPCAMTKVKRRLTATVIA